MKITIEVTQECINQAMDTYGMNSPIANGIKLLLPGCYSYDMNDYVTLFCDGLGERNGKVLIELPGVAKEWAKGYKNLKLEKSTAKVFSFELNIPDGDYKKIRGFSELWLDKNTEYEVV